MERRLKLQSRRNDLVRIQDCLKPAIFAILVWMGLYLCSDANGQTNVTVRATTNRSIGGVGTIDRARYFNYHGTLVPGNAGFRQAISDPNQINASPGRVSSELDQFIAQGLPEDPSNPGFFEPNALRSKIRGSYRNFVQTVDRYEPYRNAPNPQIIQSGRAAGFWPNFLRQDPDSGSVHPSLPLNVAGYADFVNTYLEEAVYGPNAFHPVNPDRFYIEMVNEPNVYLGSSFTTQDMVDMHVEFSQLVKAQHPQAKIGGYSACCSDFVAGNFSRWFSELKPFIEGAGNDMDFISIHPYDRYTVKSDGSWQRDFSKGASHTAGQMDLIEAHASNVLGKVLPFSFTEYGSWNRTDMADGSYGNYPRETQQWDLIRDIREKMMVFLDRPDRVLSATPFVSPRHWQGGTPTNPDGDNVMFQQDANGNWQETIVGSMFRMLAPVSGQYIGVSVDNPDLQSVAFRNGDEVYVVLNNLNSSDQTVNLSAVTGMGSISSATLDRIFLNGSTPTFAANTDVSGTWQNLTLSAEEGAVLTLTLTGSKLFDLATDTSTTYGDFTANSITQPGGRSNAMNIAAELQDAISAKLRVSYSRPGQQTEAFDLIVNGTRLSISGDAIAGDDNAFEFVSREIEVPIDLLTEGNNVVQADFTGNGGRIGAIVLEVTRSVGDLDGSGAFGCGDIDALVAALGTSSDPRFDITGDGMIDVADVHAWIQGVWNADLGDLNFDGNVDIADFQAWLGGFYGDFTGLTGCAAYEMGDMNFDGVGDHADFVLFRDAYDAANGQGAFAALIPEPSCTWMLLPILGALVNSVRRRSGLLGGHHE